jgi:hypothetical protein
MRILLNELSNKRDSIMKYLEVSYKNIYTENSLKDARKFNSLEKCATTHTLLLPVNEEVFDEVDEGEFGKLANAIRDFRKTFQSLVINYGQISSVVDKEIDGFTISYSDDANVGYYTMDLIQVEEKSELDWYRLKLSGHDWFYAYSDCRRTYNAGTSSAAIVNAMQKRLDKDYVIWNEVVPKEFKHTEKK